MRRAAVVNTDDDAVQQQLVNYPVLQDGGIKGPQKWKTGQLPFHEQLPISGQCGSVAVLRQFHGFCVAKPALVTRAAAAWSCVDAASQCSLHAHMAALQDGDQLMLNV